MRLTAEEIIDMLGLKPLEQEGGFFRETYVSKDTVPTEALPDRYGSERAFSTAIYYLLTADSFSAIHRVASDEVFHFYLGDPVEMLLLSPDGRWEVVVLGQDLAAGQFVQFVVPRGVWQGARVVGSGSFALMGTTVAPGFDYRDFELGRRQELRQRYPGCADLIERLTSGQQAK